MLFPGGDICSSPEAWKFQSSKPLQGMALIMNFLENWGNESSHPQVTLWGPRGLQGVSV